MAVFQASRTRIAAAIALAVASAGCTTPPAAVDDTPGVRTAIRQALVRADGKKAEMQAAAVPASLRSNSLTVIWEGEAAEILKRIAASQQLQFKQSGPMPRLPLPVFIKLNNASLAEALALIGEQCGARADVVLNERSIELRSKLY